MVAVAQVSKPSHAAAQADARGAALAVRGVNHRFDLDGAALPLSLIHI
mgnify:CR=1 FL=1